MTTASTLPAQSSDTSMIAGYGSSEWFHRQQPPQWDGREHSLASLATSYQPLSLLRLELRRDTSSGTESISVRVEISAFTRWVADLQKLQRQHRERQAAVYLDATAQRLLDALDRMTSIRWEDLPDVVQAEWRDVLRSVALLAGANLCEAGPTRIRLSEHGDKLLAESVSADQVNSEVERRSIR